MPISAHPHTLKAWTARLNGWQRLWVVLAVAWTIFFNLMYFGRNWQVASELEVIVQGLLGWLFPPIIVYAVGYSASLVVRWVYRGFKPPS